MRFLLLFFLSWLTLVHAGTDCISPYVSSTVYSSLVGWYRMDEGTGTTVYNTLNSTATGTLSLSTSWNTTGGKLNNSVAITAAGTGNVWIPPGNIPVGFGATDFSMSIWYINNDDDQWGWLVSMGMSGYGDPQFRLATGTLNFVLGIGSWANFLISATGNSVNRQSGVWHQMVATRSGTSYNLYVDNVLVGTVTSGLTVAVYDDGIRLGKGPGGGASRVTVIDEFMMWTRAISAGEVSALYTASNPGFVFNPTTKTCACPAGTNGYTSCTSCSPSFINGPGFAYGNSYITNNCSQCATGYYPTTSASVTVPMSGIDYTPSGTMTGGLSTRCYGNIFYISETFDKSITVWFRSNNACTRSFRLYNDSVSNAGNGPWTLAFTTPDVSYSSTFGTHSVTFDPGFILQRNAMYFLCQTSSTDDVFKYVITLPRPSSTQAGITYVNQGRYNYATNSMSLSATSLTDIYGIGIELTKTIPLVCGTCEPSNVNSPLYIPNRFGPSCSGTCTCGSGTCYSGMSGNGTCVCDSGYSGTTTCTQCIVGKAGVGCADCTAGRFTNTTGATVCIACTAGKYSLATASVCVNCDVGRYSSSSAAGDCLPCAVGTYAAVTGVSQCSACNPGSVALSTATTQCAVCTAGKYSVDPTLACIECSTGSYSSSGASSCIPCDPGTSAVNTSMSACVACAAGTIAPDTNTVECIPCDIGKYSFSVTRCNNCQAGKFGNVTGLSVCQDCGMGKYTSAQASTYCDTCPIGRYNGGYGVTTCSLCSPGTYSNITGRAYCSDCEPGWSTSSFGTINCTVCANGFFSDAYGFTSCLACNPGTFANHTGMTMCMLCEEGKFAAVNASGNCSTCPSGYNNFIPGAVNCTLIPTANLGISYTAQRNPNITEPPVTQPRGSLLLTLPIELDSIVDMNRFMGTLVFEIAKITNTSWELIFITNVRAGSLIVEMLTPLTTAQILQQFVRPGLDPLVYPFLSQATSVEIQIIPAQMPPNVYATYYDVECRSRNTSAVPCAGIGTCNKGICQCDACSVKTAAGPTPGSYRCFATTDFPDVCESEYTTTESINYEFTCASLGSDWFNLFPKRRYCQHSAYPVGSYPNRYRAVWGRSPSLEVDFTRGLNGTYITPGYSALSPARPTGIPYRTYDVYLLKELVSEAVYTLANSTLQTRYSGYAYVANLYEGENPIENKRLAWIVANYLYGVGTLQLVYLLFLPGIEGTAGYYWANNRWNPKACGVNEYAASSTSCECFEHHLRTLAGVCVPACTGGLAGKRCTESCDLTWNKNTWLTYADCSRVECLPGYVSLGGACVTASAYSFDSNNVNSYNTTQAPFWSLTVILTLTGSIVSVLGVAIAAWSCKSKHCKRK